MEQINDDLNAVFQTAQGLGYQADVMGNHVQVTAHLSESTLVLQTADCHALYEFHRCAVMMREQGL